jgi:MauM/NapG family ferredoxin protein
MVRPVAVRRVAQAVSVVLFALLVPGSRVASPETFYFFDLLGNAIAALAARALFWSLAFSLALVFVTFVLGRVFCGWACPLGALIDGIDFVTDLPPRAAGLRRVKHHLLVVLLVLAAFGVAASWWLDPLVWAGRLFAPLPDWAAALAVFIALAAVALALGRRGFCRVACPLGAMLGWVASLSPFEHRVGASCTACGLCVKQCRMRALGPGSSDFLRAECVHCRECDARCPEQAIEFEYLHAPVPRRVDPLRRQYLAVLGGGAAIGAVARFIPEEPVSGSVLRPPGAVPEAELADRCIRCGTCVRECPTHTLSHAVGEARVDLFQTPVLVARDAGCAFECNVCGWVCPTGAIAALTLAEKQRTVIGRAKIDRNRCAAVSRGRPCLVCYAACPIGAIELGKDGRTTRHGQPLFIPRVVEEKCTGCGLCEARCPVAGPGAIRVTPHPRP